MFRCHTIAMKLKIAVQRGENERFFLSRFEYYFWNKRNVELTVNHVSSNMLNVCCAIENCDDFYMFQRMHVYFSFDRDWWVLFLLNKNWMIGYFRIVSIQSSMKLCLGPFRMFVFSSNEENFECNWHSKTMNNCKYAFLFFSTHFAVLFFLLPFAFCSASSILHFL